MLAIRYFSLALCALGAAAISPAEPPPSSLTWRLLGNDSPAPGICCSVVEISLSPEVDSQSGGAFLYFNFVRKPAENPDAPLDANYEHVNGDLFRLPVDPATVKGGVLRARMTSAGAVLNVTDAPAGFFLVWREPNGAERVAPVTAEIDLSAVTVSSGKGSAAQLHAANQKANTPTASAPLIPQPVSYQAVPGVVELSGLPIVGGEGHEPAIELLADAIVAAGGDEPARRSDGDPNTPAIRLSVGEVRVGGVTKTAGDEAYSLATQPGSGVRIVGSDDSGLYYGVQTLAALIANASDHTGGDAGASLPAVTIRDAPHFGYRGLHLDVARNFQTPATVRKLLDLMAAYKLNRFHLHLTDDEGWRLAIRGLPELTSVGGQRGFSPCSQGSLQPSFGSGPCPDALPGSGHYTREEFVALLRYAADRRIEVIPEIDLPGHARAAIKAMQARYERLASEGDAAEAARFLLRRPDDTAVYESVQLWDDNVVDVRLDSSAAFVEHVVADLASMYREAGLSVETIHFGGDEVPAGCWEAADGAERQSLFVSFMDRCAEIARRHGARSGGWEEVFLGADHRPHASPGQAAKGLCYAWNNIWGWGLEDAAYRLANAGTDVVLCGATHLYFDLAYSRDVDEPGYYWAGTTDTEEVFRFQPLTFFEGVVRDRSGAAIDPEQTRTRVALSATGRGRIRGIQGQLWGENLISADRVDYLGFPRILALAERAWVGPQVRDTPEAEAPRSWEAFAKHLVQKELPRLDHSFGGVRYRVPTAQARQHGELVEAFSGLPGMTVRYTADGSDPTRESPRYTRPLPATGEYRFRVFNSLGRGGRTTAWTPKSAGDSR